MRAFTIAAILAAAGPAAADDSRTYRILVEGKAAGQFVVKVSERDGNTECRVTAKAEVPTVVGTYRYSLESQEVWRDGKLTGLRSTADDDGTKHEVSLTTEGKISILKADGKETKGGGTVWPTTYWRLPPSVGPLMLLDSDTGKLIPAKLEQVGADKVQFLGKEQAATKYRLTGGVDVTLWYDAGGRLVRETFAESGHQTVLERTEQSDK